MADVFMSSSALLQVTELIIPVHILYDVKVVVLHSDNIECSCLTPPWTGIGSSPSLLHQYSRYAQIKC